ncbi:Hypothetical protein LUCI_5068 [Lucifera butyrica]|uniref:Uncharacterized protein n=1 Tax=Lucifera butyrica TaxID=1351585 RepID=A0A498RG36_9FIRM|nr:hypothetical protein [Lucifera butyrica]VBB09770.1 Hypothetical protein LUCI_5068 [Lucifera butyrica]
MILSDKTINTQLFMQWLQVMATDMERHHGDLYFEGAAKSYHLTLQILQSGLFDRKESENA